MSLIFVSIDLTGWCDICYNRMSNNPGKYCTIYLNNNNPIILYELQICSTCSNRVITHQYIKIKTLSDNNKHKRCRNCKSKIKRRRDYILKFYLLSQNTSTELIFLNYYICKHCI